MRVALDDVLLRVEAARDELAQARQAEAEARERERKAAACAMALHTEAGNTLAAIGASPEVAGALSDLRQLAGADADADFAECVRQHAASTATDDLAAAALDLLTQGVAQRGIPDGAVLDARRVLGMPVFERDDSAPEVEVVRYEASDEGMVRISQGRQGEERLLIANFHAEIVAEILIDDGVDQRLEFDIRITQAGRTTQGRVRAGDLGKTDWAIELFGASACITAGASMRDHVRAAVQMLSTSMERRTVYAYSGWVVIDGVAHFLHAGGAITPDGLVVTACVELPAELARIHFQDMAEGEELIQGIQHVHDLVRVADPRLITLLLGILFRSALPGGPPDLALWLEGGTGRLKTSLVVVIVQFLGRRFSASGLPNWSSTANALEATLFTAKDVLTAIDDAAPDGTARDRSILAAKAARILRAQANHAGRARANADGSLRGARPPRGTLVVTAEDLPIGASVLARTIMFTVQPQGAPGGVDSAELLRAQALADAGIYEAVFARFVRYLAQEYGTLANGAKGDHQAALGWFTGEVTHLRTPSNVAHLLTGWSVWLRFVVSVGGMTSEEADEYFQTVHAELLSVAAEHDKPRADADPVTLFRRYLASAIGSCMAHVATCHGHKPEGAAWGWQLRVHNTPEGPDPVAEPRGDRIGWLHNDGLCLDLDAALRAVNQAAGRREQGVPISAQAMGKRLRESGHLLDADADKRHTVRRKIEGAERRVYLVSPAFLDLDTDAPTRPRTASVDVNKRCSTCGEPGHTKRDCVLEQF